MTCGTLHPSLEAGAARPSGGGGSDLLLGNFDGFTTSVHTDQAVATAKNPAKSWMQEWTVWPAYPVTTHRITQRPLERSP